MLKKIQQLPTDKRIAGVHSIPLMEDGSIVMVWDRNQLIFWFDSIVKPKNRSYLF